MVVQTASAAGIPGKEPLPQGLQGFNEAGKDVNGSRDLETKVAAGTKAQKKGKGTNIY